MPNRKATLDIEVGQNRWWLGQNSAFIDKTFCWVGFEKRLSLSLADKNALVYLVVSRLHLLTLCIGFSVAPMVGQNRPILDSKWLPRCYLLDLGGPVDTAAWLFKALLALSCLLMLFTPTRLLRASVLWSIDRLEKAIIQRVLFIGDNFWKRWSFPSSFGIKQRLNWATPSHHHKAPEPFSKNKKAACEAFIFAL